MTCRVCSFGTSGQWSGPQGRDPEDLLGPGGCLRTTRQACPPPPALEPGKEWPCLPRELWKQPMAGSEFRFDQANPLNAHVGRQPNCRNSFALAPPVALCQRHSSRLPGMGSGLGNLQFLGLWGPPSPHKDHSCSPKLENCIDQTGMRMRPERSQKPKFKGALTLRASKYRWA